MFQGQKIFEEEYSISVHLTSVHRGASWVLNNIYGPCMAEAKEELITWFQNIQSPDDLDWFIAEDFNYVRYPENRNRARGEVQDMLKFNEAISNLGIVAICL
jgi:hypothetical protein